MTRDDVPAVGYLLMISTLVTWIAWTISLWFGALCLVWFTASFIVLWRRT